MSYLEKQKLIELQRFNYPNYPFLDNRFTYIIKDLTKVIQTILFEEYVYSGIKRIYLNNTFQTVYEFYKSVILNSFINTKFLYVPVTYFEQIKSKLPFLSIRNTENLDAEIIQQPRELNLFTKQELNLSHEDFFTYLNLEQSYWHPFLPEFYFTGKIYHAPRDTLYEYQDNLGFYGDKNRTYFSILQPHYLETKFSMYTDSLETDYMTGLRYPISNEALNKIEKSVLFRKYVGGFPAKFKHNLWGTFTGFVTKIPKSNRILFLYKDFDGNNQFLSDEYPMFLPEPFLQQETSFNLLLETRKNILIEQYKPRLILLETNNSLLGEDGGEISLE